MVMVAVYLVLLLSASAVYAVEHTVGGSSGWDTSVSYTAWAASQTFTVGDTLLFTYAPNHGVDQVGQDAYTNCATSNPINSYTGGQNTISLDTAGPLYFICPTIGHCGQGMRLAITVVAASTPGGTPPTTPSPPSGSSPPGTPSSTPTPTTVSPPPPPSSGASSAFGNLNTWMLGFSLVLVPVVAFVG